MCSARWKPCPASDSFSHACVLRRSSGGCVQGGWEEYAGHGAMSGFDFMASSSLRQKQRFDFNAPNRLKLGWIGHQSVVTYDTATRSVSAYVSALYLGPNFYIWHLRSHLLIKIPCSTCTSASSTHSWEDGNVYVSFRGDNAANSKYGVDNKMDNKAVLKTFEDGACTQQDMGPMTNRVHVHYQCTGVSPTELWTTLGEGESYWYRGIAWPYEDAWAIHVCKIDPELGARVTVGANEEAAKALC